MVETIPSATLNMESKIYLNRYRLCLDEIGLPTVLRRSASEGTFKAEDIVSHEKVALQIIPLAHLRPREREQLEADALRTKQLSHINIPAVKDFGREEDQLAYVTEYFEGTAAGEWVKERGLMPVAAVFRIAAQVVSAMAAAAFHGIFHPAINPDNIMLVHGQTAEGEWPLIKVLNFIGATGGNERSNFISPEQLENGVIDFRSGIYSLGGTLLFLLGGIPPRASADTVTKVPGVPSAVRRLLESMLAVDPNERPLDPIALQEQIQSCLLQGLKRDPVARNLGLPLSSATGARIKLPRRKLPIVSVALAALLLTIATLALVFLPRYFRASHTAEKIGVRVGVTESSAAPSVTRAAAPSTASPVQMTSTPSEQGAEPPVLVSAANAGDEANKPEPSTEISASEAAEQPAETSSNRESSATQEIVARSPGPTANESSPEVTLLAEKAAPIAAPESRSKEPPNETSSFVPAPPPEPRPIRREETRRSLPRTPRATGNVGPVRGDTIQEPTKKPTVADPFGTPLVPMDAPAGKARYVPPNESNSPSERERAAPSGAPSRPRPSRPHARPAATPIEGLPVLPALPPD